MNTPGNKAAKKARQGQIFATAAPGKRNAIAFEVEDISYDRAPAGAFKFVAYQGERCGIVHACPCGCGQIGALYWKNPRQGGANWSVEGEWPKVTLRPSIGFYGSNSREQGHHWHGYLTNGVFEEI